LYYHVKGDYKPIRFRAIRKTEEGEKGIERLKAKKRTKGRARHDWRATGM
jgi:hypothetical protein